MRYTDGVILFSAILRFVSGQQTNSDICFVHIELRMGVQFNYFHIRFPRHVDFDGTDERCGRDIRMQFQYVAQWLDFIG